MVLDTYIFKNFLKRTMETNISVILKKKKEERKFLFGRPVPILVGQEAIDSFFTFNLSELEFKTFTYTLCSHCITAGWTYHRYQLRREGA